MSLARLALCSLVLASLFGCGEPKAVIPTTDLTEEQKAAIKAEDAKVAAEESHGAKENNHDF